MLLAAETALQPCILPLSYSLVLLSYLVEGTEPLPLSFRGTFKRVKSCDPPIPTPGNRVRSSAQLYSEMQVLAGL